MNNEIKKLIDYKSKSIERAGSERAVTAIRYEIISLQKIEAEINELTEEIKMLKEQTRTLTEAKAIAEMVVLLHGVPAWDLQEYYNSGLEATLSKLENLFEENEFIVPIGIKNTNYGK